MADVSNNMGQLDEFTYQWGAQHAQGIRWEGSEQSARSAMQWLLKGDQRRQGQARGKVRLVRRMLGPVEVVENPYEAP